MHNQHNQPFIGKKKRGLIAETSLCLVAGTGLEPMTFGL